LEKTFKIWLQIEFFVPLKQNFQNFVKIYKFSKKQNFDFLTKDTNVFDRNLHFMEKNWNFWWKISHRVGACEQKGGDKI